MTTFTLGELAAHVNGQIVGNPAIQITSAASLEQAGDGQISFLSNPKYAGKVKTTKASAVVVKEKMDAAGALLIAEDPYYAFMRIMVRLHGHRRHPGEGVSDQAVVAPDARIGAGTRIGPFTTISEKVRIGDNCVLYPGVFVGPESVVGDDCILYPNAVIYDRCRIGDRVIIHANATVGEDGFGFATHGGAHHKIPHIGGVTVEDDVELGAGSAIERGALDDTVIGQGCKVGDAVVIGHGTKVGAHCLLVPQVGIAGSTTLGHHCVAGGQVGIAGHLNIGNGVMMGGQSGIGHNAKDGERLFGAPAFDAEKAKRAYFLIRQLPDMWKEIKRLRKQVEKLSKQTDA